MVRSLLPLTSRFAHLLDEPFFRLENGSEGGWFAPTINVVESDQGYEVSLDLPGMKADAFGIEFKDGQLWISGERKAEPAKDGHAVHVAERRYGQFRRVVSLPVDVAADQIEASYKDGVLTVSVPKAPTALPRKIVVKS
jgi:HSP20 family protein